MRLRTEIVTDPSRFASLAPAWQSLWDRSGSFIFQNHHWLAGWLAGMEDRRENRLQIALAWDGDRLCGALPCAVHRRSGLRVLTWAAQLFSDYCDCLLDLNDDPDQLLSLLWDTLMQAGGFDVISLQQIRPDAKCRPFLDRLVSSGTRLHTGDRSERCMRIENQWPNGHAFFRSLNKKGRNNHTRGKRILTELGGEVRFRYIEPPEDATPMIEEVLRLKEIWLRANDPTSPLLGPDRFILRTVLDRAWRSGLARMFALEAGDKIAAASFNFVYAGRMEAYFTAYDASFERASPGTILIVEYAQWAFDRGLSRVDFLRGDEAFKFRLANAETQIGSFTGARTLMGQLAISGHRWLSRLRHRSESPAVSHDDELEPVA